MYIALKEYEHILQDVNKILSLDPTFWEGYMWRGEALYHLKQYENALLAFQESFQINSNNKLVEDRIKEIDGIIKDPNQNISSKKNNLRIIDVYNVDTVFKEDKLGVDLDLKKLESKLSEEIIFESERQLFISSCNGEGIAALCGLTPVNGPIPLNFFFLSYSVFDAKIHYSIVIPTENLSDGNFYLKSYSSGFSSWTTLSEVFFFFL